jgi:hypothetical protein
MLDYQQSFIERILPLVGRCSFGTFNSDNFGHVMSLQTKIIKHIQNRNAEKLAMYIAFCVQEWNDLGKCPIDFEGIIRPALDIIRA